MKHRYNLILLFLLLSHFSPALDLNTNQWVDFEGKLGNLDIRLSLFRLENGKIAGNYCYKKYDTKIKLVGRMDGNKISLSEIVNGKSQGNFTGVFTNKNDSFEGKWTNQIRILDFNLHISSIPAIGNLEHRYSFFDKTDDDVEIFMRKVKKAILTNNKVWIAKYVNYPLRTHLSNKKAIIIKTPKQLIANFDEIFHEEFKKEIAPFCCCNLFFNSDGAMLGDGHIWINPGNADDVYPYTITAINNVELY